MKQIPCPCGSGKTYAACCSPFHKGLLPINALQLMRSRYTAYVLNLPAYIIQTTHLENPHYCQDLALWTREISTFSLQSQFKKLDILDFQENQESATVTFVAHLSQNGQDATFKEKSEFKKVEGRWLYFSGVVTHSNF